MEWTISSLKEKQFKTMKIHKIIWKVNKIGLHLWMMIAMKKVYIKDVNLKMISQLK